MGGAAVPGGAPGVPPFPRHRGLRTDRVFPVVDADPSAARSGFRHGAQPPVRAVLNAVRQSAGNARSSAYSGDHLLAHRHRDRRDHCRPCTGDRSLLAQAAAAVRPDRFASPRDDGNSNCVPVAAGAVWRRPRGSSKTSCLQPALFDHRDGQQSRRGSDPLARFPYPPSLCCMVHGYQPGRYAFDRAAAVAVVA